MKVSALRALEVFDSRGMPTLKVSMDVDSAPGEFFVPAGASTGKAEAKELRDGGNRYGGKGVRKAAVRVLALGARLNRVQFKTQAEFDAVLEEEDLPGNVSLGLSGAFARGSAASLGLPLYEAFGEGRSLPRPMVNLISGRPPRRQQHPDPGHPDRAAQGEVVRRFDGADLARRIRPARELVKKSTTTPTGWPTRAASRRASRTSKRRSTSRRRDLGRGPQAGRRTWRSASTSPRATRRHHARDAPEVGRRLAGDLDRGRRRRGRLGRLEGADEELGRSS
jgi:hypothetical protein